MPKKNLPDPILEAIRNASKNEEGAYSFMEAQRWGDEPACPRCGDVNVYPMKDRKGLRHRHFRWRCRGCSKMFSVRTGTVLEESRLPLHIWVHAFWRMCASKKGVSALQISRECDITHKSALFLLHRIRLAMATPPDSVPKLTGDVEADETYVGGKPRHHIRYHEGAETNRLIREQRAKKTPIFAVVQRGGQVRASVVTSVTKDNLRAELKRTVDFDDARLITDEAKVYTKLGREFSGGHETVEHGVREYVRGEIHTNTIEGFFALIKRGIYGTFHNVSRRHLHRYVAEFEFRYNHRNTDDSERTIAALRGAEGKRLTYREPSMVVEG